MGVTAGLLIGAGIAAAGGIAGSAISSAGAKDINEEQLEASERNQLRAMQYNTAMYERQKTDQEALYNKYQSPEAIARQLRAAGINPAAVLGSSGSVSSSMPSVPSASGISSASVPSLVNPNEGYANVTHDLADSISKLSSSKISLDQNKPVIDKLKAEYDLTMAKTQSEQAIKAGQDIDNAIKKLYGADEVKNRISLMQKQATLAEVQGDYSKAHTAYQNLLTEIGKIDKKKNEIELSNLSNTIALQQRLLKLQGNAAAASAADSYASAGHLKAQMTTINALRQFEVDLKRWDALLAKQQHGQKDARFSQELRILVNQANSSDFMPDTVKEELRKAAKENDWFVVKQILGITNTAVGAYGAYKGAKTGQGFVDAQDVRNQIQGDWIEWQKSRGKTYEVKGFK